MSGFYDEYRSYGDCNRCGREHVLQYFTEGYGGKWLCPLCFTTYGFSPEHLAFVQAAIETGSVNLDGWGGPFSSPVNTLGGLASWSFWGASSSRLLYTGNLSGGVLWGFF